VGGPEARWSPAICSEVRHANDPVGAQEQVLGLEVAVGDARGVGVPHGAGDVANVGHALQQRERGAHLGEGAGPLDQLAGEVGDPFQLAELVDPDDPGVAEAGRGLALALHAGGARPVVAAAQLGHLQGHRAAGARVDGPIDHAHGARAQGALQQERAEATPARRLRGGQGPALPLAGGLDQAPQVVGVGLHASTILRPRAPGCLGPGACGVLAPRTG
jgi:hypothetical protein